MENLDQWTSDAFKNVENDLLQKKERRKAIVQEIEQCRNDIVAAENNLQQLEKNGADLQKELALKQWQLEKILNQMPRNNFNNTQQYELEKKRYDMMCASVQNEIAQLNEKLRLVNAQILTEKQKISDLRRKISQLQSEDNEIVNVCKQHMTTQRNVAAATENAIREHTLTKKILDEEVKSGKYGKAAIQKVVDETEKALKKYQYKKGYANSLVALAYAIIYGDYDGGEKQTPEGEDDGPHPGPRPSPRIWDKPADSTSTDYTYKPRVQDVTPCFPNQNAVEEFRKIYGLDGENDNDINTHKRR